MFQDNQEARSQALRDGMKTLSHEREALARDPDRYGKARCRLGDKYGRLTVIGKAASYVTPAGSTFARWVCLCTCGTTVEVLGNDLHQGSTRSCGCLHREVVLAGTKRGYGGDDITYSGAHARLNRVRGKASQHRCVDCGGPAQQWSHVPGPRSRVDPRSGRAFSPDPMAYLPRCIKCHRRFDRDLRPTTPPC